MTVAAPCVASPCRHWDRIETPNGLISKAVCQKCGRVREYENYRWPDYSNAPLFTKDEDD